MLNSRSMVESPVPSSFTSKQGQDINSDANLALFELEKGLRSGKIGEQCEAIVQLSSKLEKYPFPLLVHSAFLKLADVFRVGSNFLRLCVLKAIQSCKKHLDKIFNVDEFCRRFFAVIHSNDAIARSVTLRVFGHISSIVADRKNIHNCIRTSLDSHDAAEVEAAIFATKCFAEQSRDFASSIWKPVTDMIKGLSTPIETKLKLIPVLKFVYHDTNVAKQIFTICEELLASYPSHQIVTTVLNTTTQLALSTLLHIQKQIDILLNYSTHDARKSINLNALNNLHLLARTTQHLWTQQQVQSLVKVALNTLHGFIKIKVVTVLSLLSESDGCRQFFTSQVLVDVEMLCNDLSLEVSSNALKVKVQVLIPPKSGDNMDENIAFEIENDLQTMLAMSLSESSLSALAVCLSAIEVFLKRRRQSEILVDFICEALPNIEGPFMLQVLHMLVSMATKIDNLCSGHIRIFLDVLQEQVKQCESKENHDIIVSICTLMFQLTYSCDEDTSSYLQNNILQILTTISSSENYWVLYRVARQAARLGFSTVSSSLLRLLSTQVSSESLYFWLNSLTCFEEGEANLSKTAHCVLKLQELLTKSHNAYQEGLTNLKAAITTDHPLYFQFKYSRLRSDTLRAYSQLLTCCSVFKLNPPPSNAIKQAKKTGQDPYQFSRVAVQFQNCAAMFSNVAYGYQNLYKISFNADQASLNTIKCLQESCQLMVYAIESMFSSQTNEPSVGEDNDTTSDDIRTSNHHFRHVTNTNTTIFKHIKETRNEHLSIHNINTLTSIIQQQLSLPFIYPLFYFKRQQNTSIQLSVSPPNCIPEDPCVLYISHQMSVKVEGVVINSPKSVFFRRPSEVRIQLKMRPSEDVKNPSNEFKPVQVTDYILEATTVPRHDFFSAQFLVPFQYVGRHSIKITSGLTDQLGVEWETGSSYSIFVEVQEQGVYHVKKK